MVKFSSAKDAACEVTTKELHLLVFPQKLKEGTRAIASHPEEEFMKGVISWPGEYDFDGIFFKGIGQSDGSQVSYVADIEGVRCAFVDAPLQEWSDSDIEKLGAVDVLLVMPDKEKAVREFIETVDPRVIIFPGTGDTAAILKALGESAETVSEIKIQSGSLPQDTRKVVVLK